jgi:hypothetical protein
MTDDEPTTPTTSPPADTQSIKKKVPPRKKYKKDQPDGMKVHGRGTIAIQDLCADLKINASSARYKLRQAGIKKSLYGGYEWERNSPEYKQVRKLQTDRSRLVSIRRIA